jgi:GntR family transcriptional regulator, sialic acid-inducible nan operon repressor
MVEPLVIERRKLFEHVAAHLEGQILSGKLRPGDQLPPERDLQGRFGVGRPAIREALITLQRAGLVEISNGARARVSMPTASNIFAGMAPGVRQMLSAVDGQKSFQEARLFFEVGLVRQAARNATREDIDALRHALDANKAAIGERERFIETDVAFHFEFARIARNPIFVALHDQISAWLTEQRVVTLMVEGQEAVAYAAHQAIFGAVERAEPDAAEEAMRAHLTQLADTFWQQRDHEAESSA